MPAKVDAQVVIDGKVYTMSGYESEEYLKKVASYLNHLHEEFARTDGYIRLSPEQRNVFLQLNIADDFYKAKAEILHLEEDLTAKEKELQALKHELVTHQMKLGNLEKTLEKQQKEQNDNEKTIVRLETELKAKTNGNSNNHGNNKKGNT